MGMVPAMTGWCISPKLPDEGRTSGSMDEGTPNSWHSHGSHVPVWMLKSMVRLALVGSVAWTSPWVRFQISHESTVPNANSPASARSRAPGTVSKIQAIFEAE